MRRDSRGRRPSPAQVTLAAAGFYLAFTLGGLALHGWDPLWFVWIGEKFIHHDPRGPTGYDGQFVYYIARDGLAAAPLLDNPPYRLRRVLMPAAAALLSGGDEALLPWAILLIGLASIAATTWLLARRLEAGGLSAACALCFSFYVGTFLAYSRALTEPLAFALATPGALAWIDGKRAKAWTLLALAALAKEITLLFAIGLAAAELWRGRWRLALGVASAAAPLLVWETILAAQFHSVGHAVVTGGRLIPIPLAGIVPHLSLEPGRLSAFLFVALPAAALLVWSVRQLRRDPRSHAAWLLLVHALWTVLLPELVYDHVMAAARNATGLVVATLFVFPDVGVAARSLIVACWTAPTLVWLAPALYWSA